MTATRAMTLSMIGLFLLATFLLFLVPEQTLAQETGNSAVDTISEGLDNAAGESYSTDLTLTVFIGNMIRTLLAATGIIFLFIAVYAGILYMTAQGDENKVKKGKSMLSSAIIGLVIIVGAYAITRYVVDALSEAATTASPSAQT